MPALVAGGVSPRSLEQGQTPTLYPDQLSANTTFLQTGSGGYARVSTALMALNQAQNIANIGADITALQTDVTTLQGQVTTLQGQIATLQGQVSTLQTQVATLQAFQNSFNYQQIEISTGTLFLDQRNIYRRSIVINNALNTGNTVFTFAHGIANISYIAYIQAMASQAAGQQLPITFLNLATAPNITIGLSIWADTTNLYIALANTTFPGFQVIATLWYTATDR